MKLIIFIFTITFSLSTLAFKFSPMSQTLNPAKDKNSIFVLENDSNEPIAVQMTIAKRLMDIHGKEIQEEEKKAVTIYPDQLIVPPGEKRSIKVSWNEDSKNKLSAEQAYRIIAEQLPIDLSKNKKKGANIKVLLRYVAAFYVTSDEFESKVNVSSIETSKDQIKFVLENSGNMHQVLTKLSMSFKSGDKTIEIPSESLKGMSGENILANSKREFVFPNKDQFKLIKKDQKIVLNFERE